MHIVGDDEVMRPIDDLLVRLVRGLRTKGRIPDETLKHDRAQRPPVALVSVSLLQENLGRDVIRRSDGRIGLYRQNKNGSSRSDEWFENGFPSVEKG
jgi:hypothetical protein